MPGTSRAKPSARSRMRRAGLLGEARLAEPSNGVPSRRERVKPDAKLMFVLRRFFRGSGNERISHVLQFSFRMHP